MEIKVEKVAQLSAHTGSVYSLAAGNEPANFYSAGSDKIIGKWSLIDFKPLPFSAKTDASIFSLCFIYQKNLLLIGLSDGQLHIIDCDTLKEIRHVKFHSQGIYDIKYSPVHNRFFLLSSDGSVTVWDGDSFQLIHHALLCNAKLRNADFNPDFSNIAVACGDAVVRIFETTALTLLCELKGHTMSANAVKYNHDGMVLFTGGKDAHFNIWDVSRKYSLLQSIPAHNYAIYSIDINSTGSYVATSSRDSTVKIWDAGNFKLLIRIDHKKYGGHTASVNKLLWINKNDYLVTAGDDKNIIVWKIVS